VSEILRAEQLSKYFKGITANEDVTFAMEAGSIRAIIGPNGAGKTTFLSMISGHHAPSSGRIYYKGQEVTRLDVVDRARRGILRKFQTPSVFDELSVYENLELAVLGTDRAPAERHRRISEVLEVVRLAELSDAQCKHLSHGQRQWLEIGLLLGRDAELLLLDEPTAGMTAEETAATARLIKDLTRDHTLSIIVIEHDIDFIRKLDSQIMVLHLGRVLTEGRFAEVSADQRVRDVYLGT
jgi:urea ABC transporter ATP-binding protein UrtD